MDVRPKRAGEFGVGAHVDVTNAQRSPSQAVLAS